MSQESRALCSLDALDLLDKLLRYHLPPTTHTQGRESGVVTLLLLVLAVCVYSCRYDHSERLTAREAMAHDFFEPIRRARHRLRRRRTTSSPPATTTAAGPYSSSSSSGAGDNVPRPKGGLPG